MSQRDQKTPRTETLATAEQSLQRATELTAALTRESASFPDSPAVEARARNSRAIRRRLQFTESVTPQGLVLAWKRRWKRAVVIGLPIAAVMTVVAWFLMPAPYTAYALLKVASKEPRLVFKTAEDESDFFTYRKTQGALITSPFVLTAALRQKGIAELSTIRNTEHPVLWLEKNVVCDSYNSPEIIRIALSGDNPEEIAMIVNAVKDAYLNEVVFADQRKRMERLQDLEKIYKQTEELVKQYEKRAGDLAQQLGTGNATALAIKHQMALEDFQELKDEHKKVRAELMQEQIRRKTAGEFDIEPERLAGPPRQADQPGHLVPGSRAAALASRMEQLKTLISRFEQQVVDKDHPTLKTYRDELVQLQAVAGLPTAASEDASAGPVATRLDVLERQEQLLREELDKYSQMVENLGTRSFEMELLKSEIEKKARVSDRVGGEMEALRIELMSPARVTPLQEAAVPQLRDSGKKQKLTVAAGMGTLGGIWLLIAVIEFHTRRITEPCDLSQTMGLDMLGTLPAMPSRWLSLRGQSHTLRSAMWNNALVESVDAVRSLVLHGGESNDNRVLMVASAGPGEGKTTFACQLAGSLARSGRRTVLIDFDLRRPRLHELMNVRLEPGVCELLSDELTVETVTHSTSERNLNVIPAGRLNDNALRSLASDGASELLKQLKRDYDYVIVDSSPILYVADCAAVGRNADAAIVVARSHLSRMPAVAAACDRIEQLGISMLGTVLVGVRTGIGSESYSYDYHYNTAEPTA